MPRSAGSVRAERELVRHCHRGLDVEGLQQEVLRSLRRLLPVDAAFFATADPETLLFTGAYAEEPLTSATSLFLDNEFGRDDVNKFASLATSRAHIASLDQATRSERPSSQRYREIMAPLGLGDELRAALLVGAECWGYLCLHRTDHPIGFTSAEIAVLGRVGPHIAHALRHAILLHGPTGGGEGERPGVVLLADDLSTVAMTPEAEHLLSLIPGRARHLPLPVAVYAVTAALGAVERGTVDPRVLPSVRVRTTAGSWVKVHASRLHGSPGAGHVAVVVEPTPARATVLRMLSAYGLSPREAEVATFVLRGASTRIIADTLHISRHTIQDHLKAVFDKVGVRSRRDLVGRLLTAGEPDRR